MSAKKYTTSLIQLFVLSGLMLQNVFAEDVTIIGSTQHTLKQTNTKSLLQSAGTDGKNEKVIQLLHVQLSDEEKEYLTHQAQDASAHTHQFIFAGTKARSLAVPAKVQLSMNNVPVLDQGIHGTCVTFAVTGAIDAVIGKGDYVSQLCNLQLGSYLENHGYGISGWDGSYATTVINQIEQYGIINKEKQQTVGCGGLTQYPIYSQHSPQSFMEPEPYRALSEPVFGKVLNWSDVFQKNNPTKTLDEVKEALSAGDRLVFATLLPRTDLGTAGAVGKYKTWFYTDTWLLTPEVLAGINQIESAHEMIITGYDDDAVAVDDSGRKHKGLLTLRNSWGTSLGNYGEFYMSYDYFKLLAYDVTRFSPHSI